MPIEFILLTLVASGLMIMIVRLLLIFTKRHNFKKFLIWGVLVWVLFIMALFLVGSKIHF